MPAVDSHNNPCFGLLEFFAPPSSISSSDEQKIESPLSYNNGFAHGANIKGQRNKDRRIIGLVIIGILGPPLWNPLPTFSHPIQMNLEAVSVADRLARGHLSFPDHNQSSAFDQDWSTCPCFVGACHRRAKQLQVSWNSSWSELWLVGLLALTAILSVDKGSVMSTLGPLGGHALATSPLATFNGHRMQNNPTNSFSAPRLLFPLCLLHSTSFQIYSNISEVRLDHLRNTFKLC